MLPRPKFSLRTLLIVVAVACLVIGFYVLGSRLREAERDLRVLRNETGHLTIDDRSKVHIIAVAVDEPHTWRWRLFIPQGHRYSWNIAAEEIPGDEPPQNAEVKGFSNEPYWEQDNEALVTARLRREDDGHWRLSVESRIGDAKYQMGGVALRIPQEKLQWNTEGVSTDGCVAGDSGVMVFEPDGPIILLQRRPLPEGAYEPSPNPTPGFMIWLKQESP